jgi:hypothetical protein
VVSSLDDQSDVILPDSRFNRCLRRRLIPHTILFATYFYKSKELLVRLACFWSTQYCTGDLGSVGCRNPGNVRHWRKARLVWLFLIEGLLTFLIGVIVSVMFTHDFEQLLTMKQSFFYLPRSPTATTGVFFRKPWYSEREEVIHDKCNTMYQFISPLTRC